MKFVVAAVILAFALLSCASPSTPSKNTILREAYWFTMALGPDTTTFKTFTSKSTADTAAFSFITSTWKWMRVEASATLGRLGYGTGPFAWNYSARESRALRGFQHDLGIRETGSLDSLTIIHLTRADCALNREDVVLPGFGFYSTPGYVAAQGTMKALTNALGYPVNTVDIVCDASTGMCEEATVEFINAELNQIGHIRRNSYRITHWSGTDIIATGEDWPGRDCHATLTITIPTKDVFVHQWCTADSTLDSSSHGPSEMTLKLVGGSELGPPFDGGDLKDVHERLFKDKERYLALRTKHSILR